MTRLLAGLSCPPLLTTTSAVHPPEYNGQREKVPLGASEPSRSFYLCLIRTIEGEHAGYLTQTLFCAKLLLLGERTPDLPVCRVRGDLRYIYMSAAAWEREAGGVPEANLGWVGDGKRTGEMVELPNGASR